MKSDSERCLDPDSESFYRIDLSRFVTDLQGGKGLKNGVLTLYGPLIAYSKSNICRSSKNRGALDSGSRPESKFFFESGISRFVIDLKGFKGLKNGVLTLYGPFNRL